MSSSWKARIWFISDRSMHMPEKGDEKLPSTLERAPNGIIGIRCSVQILTMAETSSVLRGVTIATGRPVELEVDHSEYP